MIPALTDPNGSAAANKSNAGKSTGPRTAPGKQRSSLNALRHGLTGHIVVLPTEDQAAYQRHLHRFVDQFQPKGALEEQLVGRGVLPSEFQFQKFELDRKHGCPANDRLLRG